MTGADIENRFEQAVRNLHASPLQKLTVIGPWRFTVRHGARLFRVRAEREAELFFGVSMTVVLPEVISEQIYTYGLFDETVTWLVLQAVHKGDVVIDIGAHFGYFSLLFSHLVGQHGKVLSFEPTPSTFTVLQKNVSAYGNITALSLAAGSETGECAISDYGLKYSAWNTLAEESRMPDVLNSHDSNRVIVKVVRLDDCLVQEAVRPSLIKIDAENF